MDGDEDIPENPQAPQIETVEEEEEYNDLDHRDIKSEAQPVQEFDDTEVLQDDTPMEQDQPKIDTTAQVVPEEVPGV